VPGIERNTFTTHNRSTNHWVTA